MKKQADNVTMSTGGLYSLATRGAKDVIDLATPRVLDAIDQLEIRDNRFWMCDVGCADGGTSLQMVGSALERVQQRWPDCQSTVVYSDQTANDFNALVDIVHGNTDFDSWLGRVDNAWALVSGSSFYLQAVPDGTADFIFSATAMHWLSGKPCDIGDHVHMVGASGDERAQFEAQAASDWETILACRARELRPGGRMVLVNFCRDNDGWYLGHTGGVNMFDTLDAIWREFLDSGRIHAHEYRAMTLPQYYHTTESFAAPLTGGQGEAFRAGLRLDDIETRIVRCPFARAFEEHGDARRFADGLIPTIRSWNQSIFRGGLDHSRSEPEKDQLIEDYYQAYHDRVVADPAGHGMDYVHAYMTFSKAP